MAKLCNDSLPEVSSSSVRTCKQIWVWSKILHKSMHMWHLLLKNKISIFYGYKKTQIFKNSYLTCFLCKTLSSVPLRLTSNIFIGFSIRHVINMAIVIFWCPSVTFLKLCKWFQRRSHPSLQLSQRVLEIAKCLPFWCFHVWCSICPK